MARAFDPVCGMEVDPGTSAQVTHGSATYYFCSEQCSRAFREDPARYTEELERHEPPYTVSDGLAAPKSYHGTTYHFCSAQCLRQFEADPARYVSARSTRAADTAEAPVEFERHEPPYTVSDGLAAPKFGSAGSGGLEHEGGPEIHDRP